MKTYTVAVRALCEFAAKQGDLDLVYFDIGSKQEAPPLWLRCTASELQAFFEALCERF